MRLLPLTQGKFALVDDEDFDWLNQYKWYYNKYAMRKIGGRKNQKTILLHRFLLNVKEGEEVDHRNQNKLDCQRNNLRKCNRSINQHNTGTYRNNKTGYKGVWFDKKSKIYRAAIYVNNKRIYLGNFKNKEIAGIAYKKIKMSLTLG